MSREGNEVNLADIIEVSGNKNMFCTTVGRMFNFYLTGTITQPEDYMQWFHTIRHANETDVIVIHINSYGGDMFTAIQLMQAIGESDATVICSVEGACMSAATMVFLAGDQYQINEFSMFMFHNYSGFSMGKGGEMYDSVSHEREWSVAILNRMYGGFLTKKEIASILENKDIWMNANEVVKRLEKRAKFLEKEMQQEEQAEQE